MENRKDTGTRDRIAEIEKHFNERLDELSEAYSLFQARVMRIGYVLTSVLCICGLLSIYLLDQNNKRADEIQQQRFNALVLSCTQQNQRHDKTISELHVLINKTKNPRERRRAQNNVAGTIALIDALAPRRDCHAYALRTVHPPNKAP